MNKIWNSEFKEFNRVILKYFVISFILFFGSILTIKFILGMNPENVINTLDNYAPKRASTHEGYKEFLAIFFNNLIACLLAILGGFIPFIFLPIISCVKNAYFMALIFAWLEIEKINILATSLVVLVPHGIFEIPAVLYSFSIGIYLCTTITLSIIKGTSTRKYITEIKKAFIYIIIPLLLVAALIESFVVPYLINIFII